jgi:hypothetical protein
VPPHQIPAYYPQPLPRAPLAAYARTDGRAVWALMLAIFGVAFGLTGLLLGGFFVVYAGGNLAGNFVLESPFLNSFGAGLPAIVFGPIAYFLGKSAQRRIAASEGKLGGRPTAGAAIGIGIAATVIGALATLAWLVLMLLGFFGPPPA